LKQTFGEDANLAKTLLMVPLRAAFGVRIEKADRPSYLVALERLPKHTTMKAREGRWRGPLLQNAHDAFPHKRRQPLGRPIS